MGQEAAGRFWGFPRNVDDQQYIEREPNAQTARVTL